MSHAHTLPLPGEQARGQSLLARASAALLATPRDTLQTLLRLTLAVVIFPHGAQKALGWFGGYGFDGTMGFLTGTIGLPWVLGLLVIAAEFLGPIALVLGIGSRLAALGIAAVMVGAIATVHWPNGFFMNWGGSAGGQGFEYHLLALGLALAVIVRGSGSWSLDRLLARRRLPQEPAPYGAA